MFKLFKKFGILSTPLLLISCGILPGINNLDTRSMPIYKAEEQVHINPILIPITPSLLANQHVSTYLYLVAPSDVLQVYVWQHPEFILDKSSVVSNTPGVQGASGLPGYLVNTNGKIYFPLVGYVHVAGKTVDQIRIEITNRLKKYIPNPQVNVRVADFRSQKVYVLGEVEKTGFLPITDQKLSLADALALSGWLKSNTADPRYIYVIRGTFTDLQIYWLDARTPDRLLLAEKFSLKPLDVLYVSSAPAARWNRGLNQLLPTIQAIWYTQAVVRNS